MAMLNWTSKRMDSGKIDSLGVFRCQSFQPPRIIIMTENHQRCHEQFKKLKYGTSIIAVENSSFNPIVFVVLVVVVAPPLTKVIKILAEKKADEAQTPSTESKPVYVLHTCETVSYVSEDVEPARSHKHPPIFLCPKMMNKEGCMVHNSYASNSLFSYYIRLAATCLTNFIIQYSFSIQLKSMTFALSPFCLYFVPMRKYLISYIF